MPTRLPERSRAKTIHADQRSVIDDAGTRPVDATGRQAGATEDSLDTIDWLALFLLSLAVSAIFIAALVYFNEGDGTGAAAVLGGTATLIATVLWFSKAPAAAR